ncbi:zinc knuckle [Cooperia oncophora]
MRHSRPSEEVRNGGTRGLAEREQGGRSEGGSDRRRCYNCQQIGHIGKDCPRRRPRVNQIVDTSNNTTSDSEENRKNMTGLIKSARSLGIRANGDMSGPLIGEICSSMRSACCRAGVRACLIRAFMISIVPIAVLAQAQRSGFDVDSLEMISNSDMVPVYDASGNRMEFMGAVKITVELEGGRKAKVSFHIMDVNEKEILLGTNSLDQRATITRIVQCICRLDGGHGYNEGDRLIWPHMTGMVAGVYTIKGRSVDVSVVNDSDEPMICREGRTVTGQWGTEKWREGWEDVNPLMLDSTSPDMSPEQRRILLLEQIKEASSVETLSAKS